MMIRLGSILGQLEKDGHLQKKKYIVLPLLGKFKQVTAVTVYLLFLSKATRSIFECDAGTWLNRVLKLRKHEGRSKGWLFSKKDGERKT